MCHVDGRHHDGDAHYAPDHQAAFGEILDPVHAVSHACQGKRRSDYYIIFMYTPQVTRICLSASVYCGDMSDTL